MGLARMRMAPMMNALICSVVAFISLNLSAALLSAQPAAKIAGTISVRNGEVMNVTTPEGKSVEVALNPDTEIERPAGVLGLRKKRLDVTALVPGLNVVVQGLQYDDQLV